MVNFGMEKILIKTKISLIITKHSGLKRLKKIFKEILEMIICFDRWTGHRFIFGAKMSKNILNIVMKK